MTFLPCRACSGLGLSLCLGRLHRCEVCERSDQNHDLRLLPLGLFGSRLPAQISALSARAEEERNIRRQRSTYHAANGSSQVYFVRAALTISVQDHHLNECLLLVCNHLRLSRGFSRLKTFVRRSHGRWRSHGARLDGASSESTDLDILPPSCGAGVR
jgi:hypothetical protein